MPCPGVRSGGVCNGGIGSGGVVFAVVCVVVFVVVFVEVFVLVFCGGVFVVVMKFAGDEIRGGFHNSIGIRGGIRNGGIGSRSGKHVSIRRSRQFANSWYPS